MIGRYELWAKDRGVSDVLNYAIACPEKHEIQDDERVTLAPVTFGYAGSDSRGIAVAPSAPARPGAGAGPPGSRRYALPQGRGSYRREDRRGHRRPCSYPDRTG